MGDIESPAGAEPTCPQCRDLARQLAAKNDHVRGLERANTAFHSANRDLRDRLEGRRSERAS